MRQIVRAMLVLTLLAATGCNNQPNLPSPPSPGLNGTWSGDVTVEGMSARMTWTLTETGTSAFGLVLVLLPNGIVLLNGSLAGSIMSSTLTYTITVLAGGIPSNPSCTGQLAGTATVSVGNTATLAGSWTLTSSTCAAPVSNANFTLARQ